MVDLSSIKKEKNVKPPRILLYAAEGFGKSTFGSEAPNPIFMDIEDGLSTIETSTYKTESMDEAIDLITSLVKQEHEFKTLVIDSADWLENLLENAAVKTYNQYAKVSVETLSDVPYGGGYPILMLKWRRVINGLNLLRDKGMIVIMLAHRDIKKCPDPSGAEYDQYNPKLHGKTSKGDSSLGLITEWADCVLYGAHEVLTKTVDSGFGGKTEKAVASAGRVLHTTGVAGFMAKSRYDLPETIPCEKGKSWSNFWTELEKNFN